MSIRNFHGTLSSPGLLNSLVHYQTHSLGLSVSPCPPPPPWRAVPGNYLRTRVNLATSTLIVPSVLSALVLYSGRESIETNGIPNFPPRSSRLGQADNTGARADSQGSSATGAFTAWFEQRFGQRHPRFFNGSYNSAFQRAKASQRCLVVVLVSPVHEHADRIGELMTSVELTDYLAQDRFVVWGGLTSSPEAFVVAEDLHASGYPFIGLIMFSRARYSAAASGNGVRPVLVSRIDGFSGDTSAARVASMFEIPLMVHSQIAESISAEQREVEASRSLREQQEQAYQASLARDLERERLAREKAEKERREREEAERVQREQLELEARIRQWRLWALKNLVKPEPAGGPKDGVARISIRLEDGKRVIRKFNGDDPVEVIYLFVDTYGVYQETKQDPQMVPVCESGGGGDNSHEKCPENYTHVYDFNLVSSFPRYVFDNRSMTIREAFEKAKLWPSALLIFEPLEEDDYQRRLREAIGGSTMPKGGNGNGEQQQQQ